MLFYRRAPLSLAPPPTHTHTPRTHRGRLTHGTGMLVGRACLLFVPPFCVQLNELFSFACFCSQHKEKDHRERDRVNEEHKDTDHGDVTVVCFVGPALDSSVRGQVLYIVHVDTEPRPHRDLQPEISRQKHARVSAQACALHFVCLRTGYGTVKTHR